MNLAALSIFQADVCVEVGMGMFLLDLFAKSILSMKGTCAGACLNLAGCCIALWKWSKFMKG
jgi:hypothetical protein